MMEIGGKNVIISGSAVVAHGQSFELRLYPDEAFKLKLDIQLKEDTIEGTNIYITALPAEIVSVVTIVGKYWNGVHVATGASLEFASDKEKSYYGNFSVNCVGAYETFTAIFSYTLFETDKS